MATSTAVAEISLASHGDPSARTNHTIKIRARTTTGSTGVIKAALYEGGVNRSGDLTSAILTNALVDYTLVIPDAAAAAITDYSNLSIKIWGYDSASNALVFSISNVKLNLPVSVVKSTAVAEISLASHGIPSTRTNHSIKIRARTTTGSTGVIKAALYEGATNRSGNLTSATLTNVLADYTLVIPDAAAAAITDYSNLSIKFWGYDATGNALVFNIAQVNLTLPVGVASSTFYGAISAAFTFTKSVVSYSGPTTSYGYLTYGSAFYSGFSNSTPTIPVAPTFDGTTVTVPTTVGITYTDPNTGTILVTSSPITLATGTSLTVKATPNTGYYFSGSPIDQWTFTRAASTILVVPVSPSFNGTTVTVATTAGITYTNLYTGATLITGTPITLAAGTSITVKATPNIGYYFSGNPVDQWTFTKAAVLILVIPIVPSFDGTNVTVPTIAGITYKILNTGQILTVGTPITLTPGGSVIIKATPNSGYYFSGSPVDQWTFSKPIIPVPTVISPTVIWDKIGERVYQTGIDRGVLYLQDGTVVPWNGLISVEDSSTSELKSFYLEGVKYLESLSPGDYVGKLKAFTYPSEFESVNGITNVGPGLSYHEQPQKSFSLSYRTRIGNDLLGDNYGYKIHILYNVLANPDTYGYETKNDSGIQAVEFGWTLTGTPSKVTKVRPTVHISIDSTKAAPELLNIVEYALYGTPTSVPRLPSIQEMSEIFGNLASLFIIDHGDGTWAAVDMTAVGSYITMIDATTFQINNADATFLDANTYTITSTN